MRLVHSFSVFRLGFNGTSFGHIGFDLCVSLCGFFFCGVVCFCLIFIRSGDTGFVHTIVRL